jgi:hypothetical protein
MAADEKLREAKESQDMDLNCIVTVAPGNDDAPTLLQLPNLM